MSCQDRQCCPCTPAARGGETVRKHPHAPPTHPPGCDMAPKQRQATSGTAACGVGGAVLRRRLPVHSQLLRAGAAAGRAGQCPSPCSRGSFTPHSAPFNPLPVEYCHCPVWCTILVYLPFAATKGLVRSVLAWLCDHSATWPCDHCCCVSARLAPPSPPATRRDAIVLIYFRAFELLSKTALQAVRVIFAILLLTSSVDWAVVRGAGRRRGTVRPTGERPTR